MSWNKFSLPSAGIASLKTGVAAVSRIPNSMELWYVGAQGSIEDCFWYDGGNWQAFQLAPPASASLTSGVAAVSRISNSMEMWYVGLQGSIEDRFCTKVPTGRPSSSHRPEAQPSLPESPPSLESPTAWRSGGSGKMGRFRARSGMKAVTGPAISSLLPEAHHSPVASPPSHASPIAWSSGTLALTAPLRIATGMKAATGRPFSSLLPEAPCSTWQHRRSFAHTSTAWRLWYAWCLQGFLVEDCFFGTSSRRQLAAFPACPARKRVSYRWHLRRCPHSDQHGGLVRRVWRFRRRPLLV